MLRATLLRAARCRMPLQQGAVLSEALRAMSIQAQCQVQHDTYQQASSSSTSHKRWRLLRAAATALIGGGMIANSASADQAETQGMAAPASGDTPVPSSQEQVVAVLPDGTKILVIPPPPGTAVADAPEGGSVRISRPLTKPPQVEPLSGPHQLPPLPWPLDALEPHMSSDTLAVHWGRHHRTYLDNLNKQVAEDPALSGLGLQDVVTASWNMGKPTSVFNNAAQAWNHAFFWGCLSPAGGGAPSGDLAAAIDRDFGGLQQFKDQFKAAAASQFGSGWAWLVSDADGNLKVLKTANAVTPIVAGWIPLLVIDVWEHAYYLDYMNRRPDYLNTFLENLADWDAAGARYKTMVLGKRPEQE